VNAVDRDAHLPAAGRNQHLRTGTPWATAILVTAVLGGGVLRLADLGGESLWADEEFTARLAGLDLPGYLENVGHTTRNILPPLYFLLMHYWTDAFGASEFSLRLPSALAGILCIPLAYRVGSLFFGRTAGLFAAVLLAASPFHVRYSQEARMYEFLCLLSIISLWLLVRLLDEKRLRFAIGLGVTNAAMVYTHHYAMFLVAAQLAFFAILVSLRAVPHAVVRRWLLGTLLFVVLVAPWVVLFTNQVRKVYENPWLPAPGRRNVVVLLTEYSGSRTAITVALLLIATGAWRARRARHDGASPDAPARTSLTRNGRNSLLCLCVLVVPVVLSFGYSYLVTPIYGEKYLISSSIPYYFLVAAGAAWLWHPTAPGLAASRPVALDLVAPDRVSPGRLSLGRGAVLALSTVVLGTSGVRIAGYFERVDKDQWREATAYVDARAETGDLILFSAGFTLENGFSYYDRRHDLVEAPFPPGSSEVSPAITPADAGLLESATAGHERVWLVSAHSRDTTGVISGTLTEIYASHTCQQFVGVMTCLFEGRRVR